MSEVGGLKSDVGGQKSERTRYYFKIFRISRLKYLQMNIDHFPFQTLDWSLIPKEERKGDTGTAYWQVQMVNDIRVRIVEYSPGYSADHWCSKGHIMFCLEGEMDTLLEDGRVFTLSKGMCYFVGDNSEAHRSSTSKGCRLFVVD